MMGVWGCMTLVMYGGTGFYDCPYLWEMALDGMDFENIGKARIWRYFQETRGRLWRVFG